MHIDAMSCVQGEESGCHSVEGVAWGRERHNVEGTVAAVVSTLVSKFTGRWMTVSKFTSRWVTFYGRRVFRYCLDVSAAGYCHGALKNSNRHSTGKGLRAMDTFCLCEPLSNLVLFS